MIEYQVYLKRGAGNPRPDVIVYSSENRDDALYIMHEYVRKNGFSIHDKDGWFTIANVLLVEKEPIAGAIARSVTQYRDIFKD